MATRGELRSLGMPVHLAAAIGQNSQSALVPTGTTQADAAAVVSPVTVLGTATSNKGVILPASVEQPITVIYNGSGATQIVYAAGTEQINAIAAASGFSLTNAKALILVPTGQGWIALMSA